MNKNLLPLFGLFVLLILHTTTLLSQAMMGPGASVDPPAELKGEDGYVPEGLNYQAVARNEDGELLMNQRIGIRIELLSGDDGDNVEYRELHHVKTDAKGQFSLVIGQGKIETGSFKSIKWEDGNKWLQLSVDIEEKGEFSFMGKTELLSVPYAMYAKSAGNVNGNSRSGDNDWVEGTNGVYNTTDNIGIGTASPNSKLHISGGSSSFPLSIDKSGSKFILFKNSSGSRGWIGYAGENEFKVFNAAGNMMTFQSKNIFNIKVTQGSKNSVNYIFENETNGGVVRFYNEKSRKASALYDPSVDSVKVGIGYYRTEEPSERLDVRGGIKLGEAISQSPQEGGHIQYKNGDFEGYDGTQWKSLTQGSGGSGGTMPSGSQNQTLRYDLSLIHI